MEDIQSLITIQLALINKEEDPHSHNLPTSHGIVSHFKNASMDIRRRVQKSDHVDTAAVPP